MCNDPSEAADPLLFEFHRCHLSHRPSAIPFHSLSLSKIIHQMFEIYTPLTNQTTVTLVIGDILKEYFGVWNFLSVNVLTLMFLSLAA